MYKVLDPSDISISKFKVYKFWGIDNTTIGSIGITVQDGIKQTGTFYTSDPQNPDDSYKRLVWATAKHLYYPTTQSNRDINFLQNFVNDEDLPFISRSIDDRIRVLNIPARVFGERIKPESVYILSSSTTFVDDGKYNLYISGSSPRTIVGNVFYEYGQIIITSQSYSSSLDVFDLEFKSVHEIKEYEVACTIMESEFNYTTNKTAYSDDNIHYIGIFTASQAKSMITTIGLYDNDNELLMIGKLGRPFKREYDLDTTFILRVDL